MCKLYDYCENRESCSDCDKGWRDKFIPNEDVKEFFIRSYNGVRGIDGRSYYFDNTNENILPTKHVFIDGVPHCPYCAEIMFSLQDYPRLDTIGYRCICRGARAEIEYNEKVNELKQKHSLEYSKLNNEFKDKLVVDIDKLFKEKQEIEKKKFGFFNKRMLTSRTIKSGVDVDDIIF